MVVVVSLPCLSGHQLVASTSWLGTYVPPNLHYTKDVAQLPPQQRKGQRWALQGTNYNMKVPASN